MAAATVLVLAGCGTADKSATPKTNASGLTPIKLQLQWFYQAQFAGYIAAVDQGFYKEQGLDVQLLEGGTDIVPQTVLAQNKADYAVAWVPKALASREQGAGSPTSGRSSPAPAPTRWPGSRAGSPRRPSSRARRSATGASATSSSCSPG